VDKLHLKIGRSTDNDLVVNNDLIDNHHLELFRDSDGNVFITDLDSSNGTTINGRKLLGYAQLNLGDKVVLGGQILFKWEKYAPHQQVDKFTGLDKEDLREQKLQVEKKEEFEKKLKGQLIVIYAIVIILFVVLFILL
jgi:pSer/pThr/pTyr-binding forkhead associated (FHA) protein